METSARDLLRVHLLKKLAETPQRWVGGQTLITYDGVELVGEYPATHMAVTFRAVPDGRRYEWRRPLWQTSEGDTYASLSDPRLAQNFFEGLLDELSEGLGSLWSPPGREPNDNGICAIADG